MDNLQIRTATPADEPICAGWDEYLAPAFLAYKAANGELVLAEMDGNPIGYLRLEYLWGAVPYIGLIRVVPELRGRGVGKAILAHVEAACRAQGHRALYSSSQVNEAEPQAWHRAVGFVECGAIAGINPGGIGEVFFRKELT